MPQSFRFLQAGDFRLGVPITGLGEQPPALASLARDAPYEAAERLISAALRHRVAFVVLVGDLWSPDAGPGPAEFLRQQFQRLAERDVPVYWSAGRRHVHDTWASAIKFPPNVHRFSTDAAPPVVVRARKQELAQIIGQSWDRNQTLELPASVSTSTYSILAVCSNRIPRGWMTSDIRYCALGGAIRRRTRQLSGRVAHSAGMHQARHFDQTGPHGGTLVTVEGSAARLKPVAVDTLRWHDESITMSDNADLDTLRRSMLERMRERDAGQHRLLVRWHVTAPGDLGAQLRHGGLGSECLALHRADLAAEQLSAIPLSMETAYRDFRQEWLDEDTLLSEFLQVIRDFRDRHSQFEFNLPERIGTHELPMALEEALTSFDEQERSQILRDAAALGVDLLTGDVDVNAFEAAWGRP